MTQLLSRITKSRTGLNTAASYAAFGSTGLWGLVTISVAVTHLNRQELGLWTVVNAFLAYLVWMDLGVGAATGRMMAKAVADRDQKEINCWWTTTRAVLAAQGVTVVVLGICLLPLVTTLLKIPSELAREARWLLVGGILITGISLPMRGVPGLMTAQDRFHWIPLLSSVTPWINLIVFYAMLKTGFGLRSYVCALAVSQLATWIAYHLLVVLGPNRPRFDREGLSRSRFGTLFSLSSHMTIVGLVDSVLASLPAMIIARYGGLVSVPVYNFSWKGPLLVSSLVARSYQSFYPALQRLHVTGQREGFRVKHEQVAKLTLGMSLIVGGAILIGNEMLVQVLAGRDFFAGHAANIWFAMAMVIIPMAGCFRILLPISGSLGKQSLVALIKLLTGGLVGTFLWRLFGVSGIASVFALLPLFNGIYAYFRGTVGCGYRPHEISRQVAIWTILSILLIGVCGFISYFMEGSMGAISYRDRILVLPSLGACVSASLPILIGAWVLWKTLASFRRR